ncbi:hypothetical protein VTK56DRAFT_3749 [Thermocarpiscus australiensis]
MTPPRAGPAQMFDMKLEEDVDRDEAVTEDYGPEPGEESGGGRWRSILGDKERGGRHRPATFWTAREPRLKFQAWKRASVEVRGSGKSMAAAERWVSCAGRRERGGRVRVDGYAAWMIRPAQPADDRRGDDNGCDAEDEAMKRLQRRKSGNRPLIWGLDETKRSRAPEVPIQSTIPSAG